MTLTEMVMAVALLSVFFAVLLPQFRILHRSWGLKEASAECLQNGRVLLDHMQAQLSGALAVTGISGRDETMGWIEYTSADGAAMRYEARADQWVYFGPVGVLSRMAGPVSRFQMAGYAADDLDTAIADPPAMRLIRVDTSFSDPKGVGRDHAYPASIFLRTGGMP